MADAEGLDDQLAVAEVERHLGMVGDLQAKAAIYIEMKKPADAQACSTATALNDG